MSPNKPAIEKVVSPFPGSLWRRPDINRQATAFADPANSRRNCANVRKP
jgi:hypothetical protein